MGQYYNGDYKSSAFLYTVYALDSFHKLGKYFFWRQWLKSFVNIEDNFGLKFLRTTTAILSEQVRFIEFRLFICLETSRTPTETSQILNSVRWRKSGKEWPMLSNMELVVKFITKSLALTKKITLGPFIRLDTDVLSLLRSKFVIFQKWHNLSFLASTLIWIACALLLFIISFLPSYLS